MGFDGPLCCRDSVSDLHKLGNFRTIFQSHSSSRASIFSVLRLVSLIGNQAGTYPTFDPTWYGAGPVVFAALEVDLTAISASLPVFWPVLKEIKLSQILVTREVKVTLENRHDPDDDAIELQGSNSTLDLQTQTSRREYYDDPYVARQVNPFATVDFGVKADVDAGHMSRRKSLKYERF